MTAVNNKPTLNLHSIETLGALDGPGLRTVVFFQGCPLRCRFCHNPDSWSCTAGTPTDPDDIIRKLTRMKPYYGKNGGVTFSGGEPLAQPQVLEYLLQKCTEQNIHTAIDTSGALWNQNIQHIVQQANLVLLDIKGSNPENFLRTTKINGFQNLQKALEFFTATKHPLWLRIVVAQGLNSSPQELQEIKRLIKDVPRERLEILPYHQAAKPKYEKMGLPFETEIQPPTEELLNTIRETLHPDRG